MTLICPFCGKESKSDDHCTNCHVRFNKEIRSIAATPETDTRSDSVGPFSLKTAKVLLVVGMVVLLVLFVVFTEMSGSGFSSLGKS